MKTHPKEALQKIRSKPVVTRLLFGAALALLILEIPLLTGDHPLRHSYFTLDWGWAFYAALGFLGALALVFLSVGLGTLLRRDEENVDEPAPEDLDERIR